MIRKTQKSFSTNYNKKKSFRMIMTRKQAKYYQKRRVRINPIKTIKYSKKFEKPRLEIFFKKDGYKKNQTQRLKQRAEKIQTTIMKKKRTNQILKNKKCFKELKNNVLMK